MEKLIQFFAFLFSFISWLFDFGNSERRHILGKIRFYTLVSYIRQKKIWELIDHIEQKKIKGSFVECGVWRGGTAAILAYRAQREKKGRQVHLFDSFVGLPEPSKEDGNAAYLFAGKHATGKLRSIQKVVGTLSDVKKLFFSVLRLKKEHIFFHKGWFQNTLPKKKKEAGQIALLHIDGDWYASVKVCLEEFYDAVVTGGFILFDDYGYWPGCKRAVDEFLAKKGKKIVLHKIDFSGVYIEK